MRVEGRKGGGGRRKDGGVGDCREEVTVIEKKQS